MVEIASSDFTAHVLIEPLEQPAPRGTVGALVELVAAGFVGVAREVYFDQEALGAFVRELGAIARGRAGQAHLASLSPGQFELTIEATAGALVARGALRKVTPVGAQPFAHMLTTAFEPDPEGLEEAVQALEHLRSGK